MVQVEKEDYDILFLQVKRQFSKKVMGIENRTDVDTGMGFSIPLPASFHLAKEEEKRKIFWSVERPKVVFLEEGKQAGITFQILEEWRGKDPVEWREEFYQLLEKGDRRIVFYERGEIKGEILLCWLEYKSFAKREGIYNLAFLFRCNEKMVLGTFFCLFEKYDIWKKEILELLGGITETEKSAKSGEWGTE